MNTTQTDSPADETEMARQLTEDGYAVVRDVYSCDEVNRFRDLTDAARAEAHSESVSTRNETYGFRNLVDVVPETQGLLQNEHMARLLTLLFDEPWFMTRSTLFDKTPRANWGVFWHQDRAIAVKERHEVAEFRGWTKKAGIACVRPPAALMTRIIAARIHLDDAHQTNGALRVLPGTHREAMSEAQIASSQASVKECIVEVNSGDVLLMNPLLLHASSPRDEDNSDDVPTARRVIHLEFADFELPDPLEWRYQITPPQDGLPSNAPLHSE